MTWEFLQLLSAAAALPPFLFQGVGPSHGPSWRCFSKLFCKPLSMPAWKVAHGGILRSVRSEWEARPERFLLRCLHASKSRVQCRSTWFLLSRLESIPTETTSSVDSKQLTGKVSSLESTLMENRGCQTKPRQPSCSQLRKTIPLSNACTVTASLQSHCKRHV